MKIVWGKLKMDGRGMEEEGWHRLQRPTGKRPPSNKPINPDNPKSIPSVNTKSEPPHDPKIKIQSDPLYLITLEPSQKKRSWS